MNEPTDIIARMEAAQQRFNPFPSLLVSAENEHRQLRDTPPSRCEKHNWQNAFPGNNSCPYCEVVTDCTPGCECLNPHIEYDAHCPLHKDY